VKRQFCASTSRASHAPLSLLLRFVDVQIAVLHTTYRFFPSCFVLFFPFFALGILPRPTNHILTRARGLRLSGRGKAAEKLPDYHMS
jgi:hypothetical protein